MYYYIYDTFLADKKYEKTIDRVKTRLLDLEIQGKHERLTLLKSIDELISDEIKRGNTTIIVVGNDKTFLKVVDIIAKNNATLGLIPIGPDNKIAEYLGLGLEDSACEVIAARTVVKFDLGKIENQYFFSRMQISKNLERLTIEKDSYKMTPNHNCSIIEVSNFYFPREKQGFEKKMKKYSAQDGKLELVIKAKNNKKSWFKKTDDKASIDTIIQSDKFKIKSFEYLPVKMDDYKIVKTPIDVQVEEKKLRVIVGKGRLKNIN